MNTNVLPGSIEDTSLEDLRARLEEVQAEERDLIQAIRTRTESVFDVPSFAEGHPEQAIESLGLPEVAERYIGRRGLGIRTIDQLTTYSGADLEDQLGQYFIRAEIFNLSELSAKDMVEAVQAKLALKGLSLTV
jgi:hypothetical protein